MRTPTRAISGDHVLAERPHQSRSVRARKFATTGRGRSSAAMIGRVVKCQLQAGAEPRQDTALSR
jgi:hypothetical protein